LASPLGEAADHNIGEAIAAGEGHNVLTAVPAMWALVLDGLPLMGCAHPRAEMLACTLGPRTRFGQGCRGWQRPANYFNSWRMPCFAFLVGVG
jgi:hypothetical protein